MTSQTITLKVKELASGASSSQELCQRIAQFVLDEIPYYLDEWDVTAAEVLRKKQGMCAGKALLAAELYQAAGIPARFKVLKILGEEGLFHFIGRRLAETVVSETSLKQERSALSSINSLPPQRDHVIVQVFLDGKWVDMDLARDKELDYGTRLVGIRHERKVLHEEGPYDSLDGWLQERMQHRTVTNRRQAFFSVFNQQMEKLRRIGKLAEKAGVRAWTETEVRQSLSTWDIVPGYPVPVHVNENMLLDKLASMTCDKLSSIHELAVKAGQEEKLVDWLYALVRHNVKRGRFWELADVLTRRRADCLGYARLMAFLGAHFGLKVGVVEVLQDCRGQYVPHCACLVEFAGGQRQIVDPWYGSTNLRHRLMVARVKESEKLLVKPLTQPELESSPRVCGLAPEHLVGLSFYILGNAYLVRNRENEAVDCYNASLWLYPGNPRTLFNRAVAFERMHQAEPAREDYRSAFALDPSLVQIPATIEGIESMIELDGKGISELDQQLYLLRGGFVTGNQETWDGIARRCNLTPDKALAKYNSILTSLASNSPVAIAKRR